MEDFGGSSLREFALGGRRGQNSDSDTVSSTSFPETRPSLEDLVSIAVQIAEGLEVIHSSQVVHKDINPDNIIAKRSEGGELMIQIIDFNLAEVTERGCLMRIPFGFIVEESGILMKCIGFDRTNRTNAAYCRLPNSLGVTLWELLVGRRPFNFDDATEYVHAHLAKEIEAPVLYNPDIPVVLSDIVQKVRIHCWEDTFDFPYLSSHNPGKKKKET
ncbi:hypothetical protein HK104_007714 [Borealophlyctis nickersoniae]|nr:hypothetical protein HK104_007714 [Borealophlyctis nickersoniae]